MTRMNFFAAVLIFLGTPLVAQVGPATLTVQGQGQIAAVPDMATLTLGARAQGRTAQQALDQTSAATADILSVLRGAGVAEKDIQTRDLSLNPVWDNRRYEDNRAPKVIGFAASNTVMVRLRDLDSVGVILDAVVSEGANTFQGLQFGLQDPVPMADLARADAVADARRKAMLYADAAGVSLGEILSITEAVGFAQPVSMRMAESAMASVPVAAGEVSTNAQVTMVFALDALPQ